MQLLQLLQALQVLQLLQALQLLQLLQTPQAKRYAICNARYGSQCSHSSQAIVIEC